MGIHLRIKRSGNSDEEQSPLASGLPGRVTIIGDGMPMYDPRFDSTVGGNGTMRADDQSSWGPSSGNLIIQALNVLLGWRINGVLSVGAGLPVKYINLDSVMTAANICDEDIVLSTGGTQARYRGAGAFSTDDAPMNIVSALLAGCAGDLLDSDGQLSFLIKTNSLATPVVTFDDNDVVSGVRWDPMGGQTNLPNIISGSFTDPSTNSLYQMVPYPSVALPSEDGIDRTAPLDLGVVENGPQAQRLAKQTLQRMQYPGTFTGEYNMKGMAAKVGRIVWQSYSPRGWINKPFRVVSQKPSRSGRIALVLREEHASIYAWEAEDSAAVQVAEPSRFDPRNTGPHLLARRAAETANWEQVTGAGKEALVAEVEQNAIAVAAANLKASEALTAANAAAADVGDAVADVEAAKAAAAAALAAIDAIVSDDVLSRAEKPRIIEQYNTIAGEQAALVGEANDQGVDPANLQAKENALSAYLGTLAPAWNDLAQDTPIVGATFRARFSDYYVARTALLTALVKRAAATAEWDGVTGAGKEALLQEVEHISSDGWLSAAEKPATIREYDRMTDYLDSLVVRFFDLGSPPDVVLWKDQAGAAIYVGEPNSLGTYLNTLAQWTNTSVDTEIPNIATYNAKWATAIEALNTFAAALVGTVSTDVQQAIDELVLASNDGYWTALEKTAVIIPRDAELQAAWSILDGYANLITDTAVDAAEAAAENARATWLAYRNTVSPAWNDTTQATAINRTNARSYLVGYQQALDALAAAIREYTDIKATTALSRVQAMDSDGILAKGEKWFYVREWQALTNKYQRAVDRFLALGLQFRPSNDPVFMAQQDAYAKVGPDSGGPASSLGKKLGALSPSWIDSNVDTVIPDPLDLQNTWIAADNAVDKFITIMLANPDADVTAAAINAGVADSRINTQATSAANTAIAPVTAKTQRLDSNGRIVDGRALNANNIMGLRSVSEKAVIGPNDYGAGDPLGPIAISVAGVLGSNDPITFFNDFGGTVDYPAGFLTNYQYGKTYYIYRMGVSGPDSAGSGWGVTETLTDALGTDKVYVGYCVTPTAPGAGDGGGDTGGYTPPGGSGGSDPDFNIP